ncbi:MAG: FprA family A-type flavoprotein [Clostridiales bacterium]|nr:FprA family A-type flavoprotein [Clostridiales bacterium]
MKSIIVKDGIYWVGVKNPELRVFDIIVNTKKGTTYNSYLIDDEKVAVIDSVKEGYSDEHLQKIKDVIGQRKVDYIIVNHTELDHSGCIKDLLKQYPDAVIYASKAACLYLKKIINGPFNAHPITDGEVLSIGKRTLKFISAPFLHWPDTIFTYDENDGILFPCDAFGCHFCGKGIFDYDAGDFSGEVKYYFDSIMYPFKKYVVQAVDKIKDLDIKMICPSHGPIHTRDPYRYLKLYRDWSIDALTKNDTKSAAIFYVSAYGNTEYMAKMMKERIERSGFNVYMFDISTANMDIMIKTINSSDIVLVGSPTINQDAVRPVWELLSLVSPIENRGKVAGAFGSYGWSGEAAKMISDRLRSLKFRVVEPPVTVNFVPSEDEKKKILEFTDKILSKF